MRLRDARVALTDVATAGAFIIRFLEGRTIEEYVADPMLSSAVERKFEIVGEALGRALRADEMLEERLPDARRIIGFRDVLAHGYDRVSNELVWSIAHENLPALLSEVEQLLS